MSCPGRFGWECRYFLSELPNACLFSPVNLDSLFAEKSDEPDKKEDVYLLSKYLLSKGSRANIKMRARSNTLKFKVCYAREDDGFEKWKEQVECPLSRAHSAWQAIAEHLGVDSLAMLAGIEAVDEVESALLSNYPDVISVRIRKTRRFYRRKSAQLEVSHIGVGSKRFTSIQFESRRLRAARRLHAAFSGNELGTPENYVDFCRKVDPAFGGL